MFKIIYLIICTFVLNSCLAQTDGVYSFKYTDSLTGQYYAELKWKELAETGENAIANGLDYFQLYYRTGVAFYKLNNFFKAEKYLRKALSKNSFDLKTNQLLYLALLNEGEFLAAAKFYQHIPQMAQKNIFPPFTKKAVESISLEGGMRISGNSDEAQNVSYGSIGFTHIPSYGCRLQESFTYLTQKAANLDYTQYQFYINPTFYISKNFNLSLATHFIYSNYNVQLSNNDSFIQIIPQPLQGNIREVRTLRQAETKQDGTLFLTNIQGSLNFKINRIHIAPQLGVHININNALVNGYRNETGNVYIKQNGNVVQTNAVNNSETLKNKSADTSFLVWQPGVSLSFIPPILKDRLVMGTSIYSLIASNTSEIANSFFVNYFGNKTRLFLSYLKKGNLPVTDNNGYLYFNQRDAINYRFSLSVFEKMGKHFMPGITLQEEKQTLFYSNKPINYHSVYLTLNYIL